MSTLESASAQINDPYRPYQGTLLSAEEIRTLSQLKQWRPVLDALWCWALIIGAWVGVWYWMQWWTVLLAIPLVGNRYYALFILAHDGMHRRLFNKRQINDLFCDVFLLGPIGAITRINNRNHLLHHRHLANPSDPDRHKHCCYNKARVLEVFGYLTGITSIWNTVYHVFIKRRSTQKEPEAEDTEGYGLRDFFIIASWQVLLIGGLSYFIGYWAYPVLWLMPVFCFMFLCDNFRSFAEHAHPENDMSSDRHRLITYTANPLECAFFAPMNMNYHAAHHLWTSIPYYNLPAADKQMHANPESSGIQWRNSYLGFLWHYLRALPILECRQPIPGKGIE